MGLVIVDPKHAHTVVTVQYYLIHVYHVHTQLHAFIHNIHVIIGTKEYVPQDPILCECVNAELTFNCTIVGSGATVWRGSLLNCPQEANEITLRHNNFLGPPRMCGGIVVSALMVENNSYTSQLTVTTQAESNSKRVSCSHIISSGVPDVIGSTQLIVISGKNS